MKPGERYERPRRYSRRRFVIGLLFGRQAWHGAPRPFPPWVRGPLCLPVWPPSTARTLRMKRLRKKRWWWSGVGGGGSPLSGPPPQLRQEKHKRTITGPATGSEHGHPLLRGADRRGEGRQEPLWRISTRSLPQTSLFQFSQLLRGLCYWTLLPFDE